MYRFSFVQQEDSMQCGVACLQMICRYFGKKYSAKGLSCICAATAEGITQLFVAVLTCQISGDYI